jgi:hypothetical protein
MILTTSTTETNCKLDSHAFSIKASPIAFEILSSKLYSDPILAIVRELLCNAYDAQKSVGKEDTPIDVTIPTMDNQIFSIRDYGTGLSEEDIYELYTSFFSSSKSTNNDFTGCFGLGSKTPYAYTNSFNVVSFFNGTKYVYICAKKDGYPTIIKALEEATDQPNGLMIIIPVQPKDRTLFIKAFEKYVAFNEEIKINTNYDYTPTEPAYIKDNLKIYNNSNIGFYIKQGQNIYEVNLNSKLYSDICEETDNILAYVYSWCGVVYEVPIGTLAVTPSREQFSVDESNLAKIKDFIIKSTDIIKNAIENDYTSLCSVSNIVATYIRSYKINNILKTRPEDVRNKIYCTYTTSNVHIDPGYMYAISAGYDSYHSDVVSNSNVNISILFNYRVIIILNTTSTKKGGIDKIKKIMKEYEFGKKCICYQICIKDTIKKQYKCSSNTDNSFIKTVRNIHNTLKELEFIKQFGYQYEIYTMRQFTAKYPVKTKRTEPTIKITNQAKNIKVGIVRYYIVGHKFYYTNTYNSMVDVVATNGILMENSEENLECIKALESLKHVRDKNNVLIAYDTLRKFCNKFNPKDDSIEITFICKSAKKYFKNYKFTTAEEIIDSIKSYKFNIVKILHDNKKEFASILWLKGYCVFGDLMAKGFTDKEKEIFIRSGFIKTHETFNVFAKANKISLLSTEYGLVYKVFGRNFIKDHTICIDTSNPVVFKHLKIYSYLTSNIKHDSHKRYKEYISREDKTNLLTYYRSL